MKQVFYRVIWVLAGSLVLASGGELQQNVNPDYMIVNDTRTFAIEYVGKVKEVPPGTKQVRIWFPVPQNSSVQEIRDLTFSRSPECFVEPQYGNRIAYWEIQDPPSEVEITMRFVCTRRGFRMALDRLQSDGNDPAEAFVRFKQPDALVIVDDEIQALSESIVGNRKSTVEKVRAVYDHVLERMTYDKNHVGWGLGSTRHACEVGKGNCTDFHALFNSLCRAQGIASGFEIGLYLPYERHSSQPVGSYHCWAFFRVPGKTWVPVDCSEADRLSEHREFFFGGHTSNRVALSTGRDLVLEPKQAGAPLNYFVDPYAEADGSVIRTEKIWRFKDLD